jgi:hypothetical protein
MLSALGLNLPLKHAGARNKRGGVSARERGSEAASQSRPPPTRLSTAQGPSCFVGRPSFGSFLGRSRKERPRGGYRSKINVPKALKKGRYVTSAI